MRDDILLRRYVIAATPPRCLRLMPPPAECRAMAMRLMTMRRNARYAACPRLRKKIHAYVIRVTMRSSVQPLIIDGALCHTLRSLPCLLRCRCRYAKMLPLRYTRCCCRCRRYRCRHFARQMVMLMLCLRLLRHTYATCRHDEYASDAATLI